MSTIRIKFIKGDVVKFISHLDIMNTFQRALRRAGLEAEYSHGFNPQMQMVFGAPLSLGYTSEAEYADLSFSKEYTPDFIMKSLGKELPDGLNLQEAGIRTGKKNIMADISYAEYTFDIKGADEIDNVGKMVMQRDKLIVEKTRKGKTKTINIRPLIIEFESKGAKGRLLAKAGNSANLNPRLLTQALCNLNEKEIELKNINRSRQFIERNGIMADPLSKEALETE